MTEPKKLIEVAMPIKEVSAVSIRGGRIQHGSISFQHKWWARRPLPVCRAVIFARLVPVLDYSYFFSDKYSLLSPKINYDPKSAFDYL